MNGGVDEGVLVTDEGVPVTDGVGEDGFLSILQERSVITGLVRASCVIGDIALIKMAIWRCIEWPTITDHVVLAIALASRRAVAIKLSLCSILNNEGEAR